MKNWIRAAGIRAIKTIAQTAIATIGTSMVIADVDWRMVASASLVAGVLSILTSLTGLPEVSETTGASETTIEVAGDIATAECVTIDYSDLTVAQLKAMAKEAGLTGYGKLAKAGLIALIENFKEGE